jgi:hypothetical protein
MSLPSAYPKRPSGTIGTSSLGCMDRLGISPTKINPIPIKAADHRH